MSRPKKRPDYPPRRDEKRKRRLASDLPAAAVEARLMNFSYKGSPKHKRHPHLHGLEPFNQPRGDAMLCDEHAGWNPGCDVRIPTLVERTRHAALVGSLIWTVDDTGWVYELQVTNAAQNEHHGYPLHPDDPFAAEVISRFATWAARAGQESDRRAAQAATEMYKVRP